MLTGSNLVRSWTGDAFGWMDLEQIEQVGEQHYQVGPHRSAME